VEKACPDSRETEIQQIQLFRQAETERAARLASEIERLKADLVTAESALVEAESGLAGSHTRADAVSQLAVARIQVERASSRAPWRADDVAIARRKLEEAERQVTEGRFGAALFFVYRARRVADGVLVEADQVHRTRGAHLVRARRVNLRAGPSVNEPIMAVLSAGTPVFPQHEDGDWILVQVSSGPSGWIHRRLVDALVWDGESGPAAPLH